MITSSLIRYAWRLRRKLSVGTCYTEDTRPFFAGNRSLSTSQLPTKTSSGWKMAVSDIDHPCYQMLHVLSWFILTTREKVRITDCEEKFSSVLLPQHMELLKQEYGSLYSFLRRQGKFFVLTGQENDALVRHKIPLEVFRSIVQSMATARLKDRGPRLATMRVTELNAVIARDVRSLMLQCGYHRLLDFLRIYFPLLLVDDESSANAAIITTISDNIVPIGKPNVRTPHIASVLLLANQKHRLPEYAQMAFQLQGGIGLNANKSESCVLPLDEAKRMQREESAVREIEKRRIFQRLPEVLEKVYHILPENGKELEFDSEIKPLLSVEWQRIPMLARKLHSINSPRIAVTQKQCKHYFRRNRASDSAAEPVKGLQFDPFTKSKLKSVTGAKHYILQLPTRMLGTLIDSIVPMLPQDGSEISMEDKIFSAITPSKDALHALGRRFFAANHPKVKCRYVGDQFFMKLRVATDTEAYNQRMALDAFFVDAGVYPDSMRLPEETRRAFEALRNALPINGSALELSFAQSLLPEYATQWPQSIGKKLAMHPGVKVTFDVHRSKYMVSRVDMVHELMKAGSPTDGQSAANTALDFSGMNMDIPEIFARMWENVPTEWVRAAALQDSLKGVSVDFACKRTFLRIALHLHSYFNFDIAPLDPKLYGPEEKKDQFTRPFAIILRRREVEPPAFYTAYKAKQQKDAPAADIQPVKQFEHNIELIVRLATAMPGDFMPLTRALGQLPPKLLADLNNQDNTVDQILPQYPSFFECRMQGHSSKAVTHGEVPMSCLVKSKLGVRKEAPVLDDAQKRAATKKNIVRLLVGVVADLGHAAGGCLIEDIPLGLSKEEAKQVPKNLEAFFVENPDYFTLSDDSSMVSVEPDVVAKLKNETDTAGDITFKMEDRKGYVKEVSSTVVSLYTVQPKDALSDEAVNTKAAEWMAANEKRVAAFKRKMVKYKPQKRSTLAELLFHISYALPQIKAEKRALERVRSLNSDTNKYNDELTLVKHIVDCLPATGEVKISTVIHKLMDSDAVQVLPPSLKDLFEYYKAEISCRVDEAGMWLSRPTAKQGSKDEFQKSMRNAEYDYKNNPFKSSDSLLNPMEFPFPIPPPSDEGKVLVFAMPVFCLVGDDDVQYSLPKRLRYIAYSNMLKRYPHVLETQNSKKVRWPFIVRHTDLEIPPDPNRKAVFCSIPLEVERRWVAQIVRLLPPTGKVRNMEELRGRTNPELRTFVTEDKELRILESYPEYIRVEKNDFGKTPVDAHVKYKIRRTMRLIALGECRRNWAIVMYAINSLNVKYVMHIEDKKEAAADVSVSFSDLLKEIPVTIKKAMNNDEIFDILKRSVYITVHKPTEAERAALLPEMENEKDSEYQRRMKRNLALRLRLRYGFQRDTMNAELRKKLQSGDSSGVTLDEFEYEEHGDVKKQALENTINVLKMLCGNDRTGKFTVDACAIGNVLPSNTMRIIKATFGTFLDFIRSYPNYFEVIKTRTAPPTYGVRVIQRSVQS